MFCPYDNSDTKVTNSRPSKKHPEVWRRRRCQNCGNIWTTREYIDLSTSHRVLTRHKRLQAFSRDKLFLSIKDSLRHRKTALDDASALTDTVLSQVLHLQTAQVTVAQIYHISHRTLAAFDPIAADVYAALYKD